MATYKATGVDTKPVKAATGTQFTVAFGEYTTASGSTLAANDVIQMVKVPKGARIVNCKLAAQDLDSAGSPTVILDVGDTDNPDRFIDGSTVGQSGGAIDANAFNPFIAYTSDTYVSVTVSAAPTTQIDGNKIRLLVTYTMDEIY